MMRISAIVLLVALFLGSASLGHAQSGAVVSSTASTVKVASAAVVADPIITDFTDRMFEFRGLPAKAYSVLQGNDHMVSMRLKEGHMFDDGHMGSYISGMGLSYHGHTVTVDLVGDNLTVSVDGEELRAQDGQTHTVPVEGAGNLTLVWDSNRVEVTSDFLELVMFVTPGGTVDRGQAQPAYMNFDAALLKHTTEALEGILGDSYARLVSGEALPNDMTFHGDEADFEVEDLFAPLAARNSVLRASAGYTVAQRRRMIEAVSLSFPVRSQARGAASLN